MNDFFRETSSELEWSAARARLEDYLRAWRLGDGEQRDRIVLRVLERAARKQAEHPGLCPTALVMGEIRADMDRWFEQKLSSAERGAVQGCVAWFALDAPEKWPAAFLAENIPADCQQALLASHVRAAPDLRVASMVPQPFANPLRAAIQLPAPMGKLARELAPLMVKATAAVLSALSILSSVRLR